MQNSKKGIVKRVGKGLNILFLGGKELPPGKVTVEIQKQSMTSKGRALSLLLSCAG